MTAGARGSQIRVFLVDDHAVVREGLRLLLEKQEDVRVVGESGTLQEAVKANLEADVIVADLMLGDARGSEVVVELRRAFTEARIVVLTMIEHPADVRAALAAGASGYVVKEAAARDLVDAVRRVAAGESYLQPSLGAILTRPQQTSPGHDPSVLSDREREVLRLIALGHTNAEMAAKIGVAVRTIESHRAHIVDKLGIRTRAELVRYATETGIS